MTKVATFDGAPPAGTINFGIGQPGAELLPVHVVEQASQSFLADAVPIELNYGVLAGDARFLDSLAVFLTNNYAVATEPGELFLTSGNSQGLDLASLVFAKPGNTVFVEEPSYFLAFQIFRDRGLNIVSIPMDDEGICANALRDALESHKPAFVYTIPSFHNPTGVCTSAERRRTILSLAEEYDFLILADEVYQLLYYDTTPPPAYGTMTSSNRVISLGSFSKILAPAMRLGWIQTSPPLLQKLLSVGYVNSGGSLNHISSHIVRQAMESGALDDHISVLRETFGRRVAAMDAALVEHFSDVATWLRPGGGYFFWVCMNDESFDTAPLRKAAQVAETGFQPGALFTTTGTQRHCLRLAFSYYAEDDIARGVARLRPLFG